jgi:hypothetical protein
LLRGEYPTKHKGTILQPKIDGYSKLDMAIYVCSMLKSLHRMAGDHAVLRRLIELASTEALEVVRELSELEKIREE